MKDGPNGELALLKVRIRTVAECFKQVETKDLYETYPPIFKVSTIRIALKLVSQNKNELRQFDNKTAYLKAKLDESIIMTQPEEFEQFENKKTFSLHSEEKSL